MVSHLCMHTCVVPVLWLPRRWCMHRITSRVVCVCAQQEGDTAYWAGLKAGTVAPSVLRELLQARPDQGSQVDAAGQTAMEVILQHPVLSLAAAQTLMRLCPDSVTATNMVRWQSTLYACRGASNVVILVVWVAAMPSRSKMKPVFTLRCIDSTLRRTPLGVVTFWCSCAKSSTRVPQL
mgnify:CR=1 FL=1